MPMIDYRCRTCGPFEEYFHLSAEGFQSYPHDLPCPRCGLTSEREFGVKSPHLNRPSPRLLASLARQLGVPRVSSLQNADAIAAARGLARYEMTQDLATAERPGLDPNISERWDREKREQVDKMIYDFERQNEHEGVLDDAR